MEASTDANATTQPPRSLPPTKPPTFHQDQQSTATYNVPERMVGIMEHQQSRDVYHMEADREGEAEDIHVAYHSNNTVDFSADVQHSKVNRVPSENESEGGTQGLDIGDKYPVQCNNSVGGNVQDNNVATNNSLPLSNTAKIAGEASGNPDQLNLPVDQVHGDVNDEELGMFVDSDGDVDEVADEERSIHERDNVVKEDTGSGFDSIEALFDPQTNEIIAKHLSRPNPQAFESLDSLLSSHNAPGRGLYTVEKVSEREDGRVTELEEKMRRVQASLEKARPRRDRADEITRKARATFSQARLRSGISNRLWSEYEAFCESLEPKFGNGEGWSITCYENHNGSYLQWDPDLDLFLESAEMPLGNRNFRCEASAIETNGRTEYVVEFWSLASLKPEIGGSEAARTWEQQYPRLYQLATQAANSSPEDDTVAKQLLRSLPDPRLPFSGGWLFEYVLEPARAQHPVLSRRWSYRSACKLRVDVQAVQQDQIHVTIESESGSAASQDEDADYVESESAGSQDVEMEEGDSVSAASQDVKMEDDE